MIKVEDLAVEMRDRIVRKEYQYEVDYHIIDF